MSEYIPVDDRPNDFFHEAHGDLDSFESRNSRLIAAAGQVGATNRAKGALMKLEEGHRVSRHYPSSIEEMQDLVRRRATVAKNLAERACNLCPIASLCGMKTDDLVRGLADQKIRKDFVNRVTRPAGSTAFCEDNLAPGRQKVAKVA